MSAIGKRLHRRLLLLALGLAALPGCFGGTQNPSYFPYLFPTGDIIRTHAKPPGKGYFANFDPHAIRLEVRPLESTNPVRTQKVFLATIYDCRDRPRRKRRVEWIVEGVGNIVEVDESGYLPGRGYKVDNRYAVSYTDFKEHRFTRGNADPNDDFMVRPGQTWCVVSSAVEGDTHVTVYAPEIANWDANRVVATTHWVDAEWALPQPAVARSGSEAVLVTNVFRHTDHQPLANYRVRYRILDGPPALFLQSRVTEAVATSDLRGQAPVSIIQTAPQPGVNRIGIEIIRPPDPTAPSGVGIVIGHGETTISWQGPAVSLSTTGPAAVALGQEVPVTVTVTNTGQVETQAMTVRLPVPDGVQVVRSQPPAIPDGNQLVWTLGALPAGQAHPLQVVYRSTRPGAVTACASVATMEGLRDEKCMTTQVVVPQLAVALTGPAAGIVGVPALYQITVTNPGSGPATNVKLSAAFDAGLEHASKANPVELPVGTLAAGESKTTTLSLTPRQPGQLAAQVTATADGDLRQQARHALTAQVPQLTVAQTGPGVRFVDQAATWDIVVSNAGQVPLTNVVVQEQLPPELALLGASEGAQAAGGLVTWSLGSLAAQEKRTLQVSARCTKLTPRAVLVAAATADPGIKVQAEAALEVRGLPAFAVELQDQGDPAPLGGGVTYRVVVTNTGSLPANQVELAATVPAQLRIVRAQGPTTPRAEGQRLVFPVVDGLRPQQALTYTVETQAVQAGDGRFRLELRSETLREPVIKEESTNVYAPPGSTPPPGAAPAPPSESPPPPLAAPSR